MKNRNDLLAVLRQDCGYTGKSDKAEVQKFIADENIQFKGISFDLDKIWAQTKTVCVKVESERGDDVQVSHSHESGDDEPAASKPQHGGETPVEKRTALSLNTKAKNKEAFSAKVHTSNISRKQYNEAARKGLTMFPDADVCEVANAALRLKMWGNNPSFYKGDAEYYDAETKANDISIVGGISHKDGSALQNILGAVLIPDIFSKNLIYQTESWGVWKALTNVNDLSDGNTVVPRKTGIVAFTPVAPGGTISTSDNAYDSVRLTTKSAGLIIKTPYQLFRSAAIDLGDDLARSIKEAADIRFDSDFILGDNTQAYNGNTGLVAYFNKYGSTYGGGTGWSIGPVYQGSGTALGGITEADLYNVQGRVWNANWSRCAWLMSRQVFMIVAQRLALGSGAPGATSSATGKGGNRQADFYNSQAAFFTSQNSGMLLGFPAYFSPLMPTSYTSGSTSTNLIYFGDFIGSVSSGLVKGIDVRASDEAGFSTYTLQTRGYMDYAVNAHGSGRTDANGLDESPISALKLS